MKVLMINGSPHKEGCVYTVLSEIAGQLEKYEIQSQIFHIGMRPIMGCTACATCAKTKMCAYGDDGVNECASLAWEADGIIIGSPVYYAGPNGALCAFLDRLFYTSGGRLSGKPGAAIVNCRRGGSSAAFDRLNKYFTISDMPVVSSQYWNTTHGNTPEETRKDIEGMQTARRLGENMAWLLRSIEEAKDKVCVPDYEQKIKTSFIR